MKTKKLLCVAMAALMLFGSAMSLCACSKKDKNQASVIKKEDTWYNGTEIDVNKVCDYSDYISHYSSTPMVVNDFIMIPISAYGKGEDPSASISDLCILDLNGKLLSTVELGSDEEGVYRDILGCATENGKPVVYLVTSGEGVEVPYVKAIIDPEKGIVEKEEPAEMNLQLNEYVPYFNSADDIVFFISMAGDRSMLHVLRDGNEVASFDLLKEFGTTDVFSQGIWTEGNKIYTDIGSVNSDYMRISFDKESGKLDSEKIENMSYRISYMGYDGRSYETHADGIYVDGEPYLMFSDCGANIGLLSQSMILSLDEKKVVIIYNEYDNTDYSFNDHIFVLEKADENPNAGKTVLTASAAYFCVDKMMGEGIREFNEENEKYFIKMTCDEFDYENSHDDKDFDKYEDEFKMNLLSDQAPDLIFNGGSISGILDDDYLVDLSSSFDLSTEKYYTNVTESMKENGKLYCMPLDFCVSGIVTEKRNVKDGASGFTFDEYKEFVDKVCNGEDPLKAEFSRGDYFASCMTNMSDIWLKDGKADFSSDEFRQLANYIKDNVPQDEETSDKSDDILSYDETMALLKQQAKYAYIYNFVEFALLTSELKESDVYGIPSCDGRGPTINVCSTVGISASSKNQEGCIEFINKLLETDVQGLSEYNPISREACNALIDERYKKLKDNYETRYRIYEQISDFSYISGVCNPKDTDKKTYLDMLDNLSGSQNIETSIYNILKEEGAAYFSGQKSEGDLITNLTDRVQTVLNEKQ